MSTGFCKYIAYNRERRKVLGSGGQGHCFDLAPPGRLSAPLYSLLGYYKLLYYREMGTGIMTMNSLIKEGSYIKITNREELLTIKIKQNIQMCGFIYSL